MNKTENTNVQPLVEAKSLKKHFQIKKAGTLHAVDGVSFKIMPGETGVGWREWMWKKYSRKPGNETS